MPKDELTQGGNEVMTKPCGVVSLVLVAPAGVLASVKLYDATTEFGEVKKQLTVIGYGCAVYCPCKADAFSVGVYAVVAGDGATAYIEIE